METHELQMSRKGGFLVEQRSAFGTNERPRLRVNSLVRRQGARGRSVQAAITLIRSIDAFLTFAEMHLQSGDRLSADGTFGTLE